MYLLNHPVIYVSIYLITYRPMALWLTSHWRQYRKQTVKNRQSKFMPM